VLAAKQAGPTPIRMQVALRHVDILSYVYRSLGALRVPVQPGVYGVVLLG